ncbi:MAG TPA: hypothetical protein VFL16_03935 [Steroidobacteraceae bacterium]|nr:hypothetical protein [Steroidobacteraceae bacterium]
MARLVGTLLQKDDGAGGTGPKNLPNWTTYRVTVYYTSKVFDEERLIESEASVFADGRYELVANGNERKDENARVAVFAPSGESLAAAKLRDLLDGDSVLKPIEVRRPTADFQIDPIAAAAASAIRLSGRVFATEGGLASVGGLQVRIVGRADPDEAWLPIWSGKTDRQGYFAATVKKIALSEAVAVIGESAAAQVQPITLGDDEWLPTPVILFTRAGAATDPDAHDCACDVPPPATPEGTELAVNGASFSSDLGVGCQNFTVPNRTLEEFDFFKIARTTDPAIRGLTMPDFQPRKLELPEMDVAVFDRGTLAQATQMSSVVARNTAGLSRSAGEPDAAAARTLTAFSGALAAFQPAAAGVAAQKTLADYINLAPLSATGVKTAASWRLVTDDEAAIAALRDATARIPTAALRAAVEDPDSFTPERIMTLERRASAQALTNYLQWRAKPVTGRGEMNEGNVVDWDATREFYQATSIAHGHLLQFKQVWKADGYSLGGLIKSVPLAPGQKKLITVLDWDRTDTATRDEETISTELLSANLSHDRDINEITNAAFHESLNGGSSASVSAVGGGLGLAIGPLVIGGGGGSSWASSDAWSDNSRDFSAQTQNDLRDRTSQAASSVRNQRSTVVETVHQQERVGATVEVIANHNRCHALTIQYFEVLRHFAVQERLAGVRECLFIPLEMTPFDDAKVLRWNDILERACDRRDLLPGFDSIRRLNSPDQVPPDRRFADDPVEEMSGILRLRVSIARPKDPDEASRVVLEQSSWGLLGILLRVNPETVYEKYSRNAAKRDEIFRNEIAPDVARAFLESLSVVLIDSDGQEHDAGFDLTVLSRYQENGIMELALNDAGNSPRLTRAEIAGIAIRSNYSLPEFSKVIVEAAQVDYRTERISHNLYRNERVLDDVQDGDAAFLSTAALDWLEERNQLTEDRARRKRLLRHLNDNIERFHRAIWLGMDPDRRYMLLDGFEAPNSGGRSVASVVDNRLIGIVGNCLVMPVAPGFQLDPLLAEALKGRKDDPQAVLESLYEVAPSPPRRHSVPTRGVFAEAMTGTCKSCELIEEDRFWRWKGFPLPDAPPPIAPLSTDSRFAAAGSLAPTPLPDALVKFQTVPDAPAPTGMAAALQLLGKDVFKDLTGLTANQKNALAAFTSTLASSEAFAGEAFNLALAQDASQNIDRTLGQIQAAKSAGYLTDEQASAAARDALNRVIGADSSGSGDNITKLPEVEEAIKKAASSPDGSATVTRSNGESSESVSFKNEASDLVIGKAPVGTVRDFQVKDSKGVLDDIWLDVPLISDQITAANDYEDGARSDVTELARFMGLQFQPNGSNPFFIDIVETALKANFLRPNPADATKFQIRVRAQVGYPADPKDNKKVAAPAKGTKYAFLAMVHGNSTAWNLKNPITDTGRTTAGLPIASVGMDDREDYKGYDYLQKALAELKQPIVSISFSHAFPNMVGSFVELRSELLLEAMRVVIAEAGKAGGLLENVDFQKCGLFGHSRGGEAVVRAYDSQKTKAVPGLRFRATCSLAPTDYRGSTNAHKLSIPAEADGNYFVFYGTLDGDVHGQRAAGVIDRGGTGYRLYDRSSGDKTMVTVRNAIHDFFNRKWPESVEWPAGVPATALTRPQQEDLAIEFIGGFFDLLLNGNAKLQPLFRNEVVSSAVTRIARKEPLLAMQWQFNSSEKVIDSFSGAAAEAGTRNAGAGGARVRFASLTPPAAAIDRSLEMRVPHDDNAYRIDKASVGGAAHTLGYDLGSIDVSAFDLLTFRLGQLYPIADQPAIEAAAQPKFKLLLEDADGNSGAVDSAVVYGNQKNGWAKPDKKEIDGREATLMFLQTLAVTRKQLEDAAKPKKINLARLKTLKFEFVTDATAQDEIWLDSILFARN